MLGDICSWTSARETDRWGGRRSWVSIHTGYRREMAFTRDKDSLMDDSARCFGRSSDTPMIFWWFDRRWHGDEFARGPFATVLADLCLTQRRLTTAQPTAILDGWYRRCSPAAVQTTWKKTIPFQRIRLFRNWFNATLNDRGWITQWNHGVD